MTQSHGNLPFKISLRGTSALLKTNGVGFEARHVATIALWLCTSSGIAFAQNSAPADSLLQPAPASAVNSSQAPNSTGVVSTTMLANSESGPDYAPVWAASSEKNADLPAPVSAEPESGFDSGTDPQTQQTLADSGTPASNQEPARRALPAPLDGIFRVPNILDLVRQLAFRTRTRSTHWRKNGTRSHPSCNAPGSRYMAGQTRALTPTAPAIQTFRSLTPSSPTGSNWTRE